MLMMNDPSGRNSRPKIGELFLLVGQPGSYVNRMSVSVRVVAADLIAVRETIFISAKCVLAFELGWNFEWMTQWRISPMRRVHLANPRGNYTTAII